MSPPEGVSGTLYVVATPIGNLGDISRRALDTLAGVDAVAAEDTRHSGKLLQHFGIATPLFALHEHNEGDRSAQVLARLQKGENIALISDAGTPLISDPGYRLVSEARRAGVRVVPIPGPCALIAALCAGGLPTDRFCFEGFLPARSAARQTRLQALAGEARTLVFYEAPHRILECLEDMAATFGPARRAVLAKELSKSFETIHDAPLGDLPAWLREDEHRQRGEFVILVEGAAIVDTEVGPEAARVLDILMQELPLKQAAALASRITGIRKNALYQHGLDRQRGSRGDD